METGTYKTFVYSTENRSKGVMCDVSEELIPIMQYAIRRLQTTYVIAVKITKNGRKIALLRK